MAALSIFSVVLAIDSPQSFVNGSVRYIDEANMEIVPTIRNSSTFVPIRFISEQLGYNVAWDGATQTVTITN